MPGLIGGLVVNEGEFLDFYWHAEEKYEYWEDNSFQWVMN